MEKGNCADNISIKELNGQRVLTFKDIDRAHERPDGTAKRNFKTNSKHFIENEDYFMLKREDILEKDEIRTLGISAPNRGVTLLTESGYLMVVKSLTDDLSWHVQRQLVNGYFAARKMSEAIIAPSTAVTEYLTKADMVATVNELQQLLIHLFEMADESNKQIISIKNSVDNQNTMLWSMKKSMNDTNARANGFATLPPYTPWSKRIGIQIDGIISSGQYERKQIWSMIYTHVRNTFGIDLNEEKQRYCALNNYCDNDYSMFRFMDAKEEFQNVIDKYVLEIIDGLSEMDEGEADYEVYSAA